ncbi:hypothetical protein BT96DRAFT_988192 [Gymnopus androsaceus JB14]|uniref:Uncharacterized protein n=1 Tax=Gymnopus androsaceus JB14 TaxID=1447944 RepID=A0A6A4I8G2_9AGAR|nr:hypothetical protein BT96DRAFT_988192 [Gymnopus androsaceus JB14]
MASSSSSQSQSLKRSCITAQYLLSPLETLDESLSDQDEERIDLHDLAEAYNVLATRIARIMTKGVESAAIPLLAERSSILVPALRRDLMRVMINPCLSSDDMDPDQVQYASDLALLGQQALRVISDLFTLPELYKTIPGAHHVLSIYLLFSNSLLPRRSTLPFTRRHPTPSFPTISPDTPIQRTFALLRFILQVQKLPTNVLAPHKSKIIASVKRCLNGHEQVDGLMILAELLRTQPKLFLGPACNFLDEALKSLIDDSSKARNAAAHALSAFASAKLAHNLTYTQKVSHELSQCQSACQVTQVVFDGEGPQWAAVVMASFIVLIDYPIFDSRAMRTIKDRLWDIAEHKGRIVRRLSGPVWRCFVWAFARMPAEKDKAKEREMVRKVQTFLSQDYRSGTGAETCRVFFSHASGESVERVVEVVEVMLKEKKMQQDGLILLAQLLAPVPPQETQTPTPAPTPTRFDTNAILHSHLFNGNILKSDLPSLHEYTPRHKADVRPLSVQETINHWDELYDFWMVGAGLVLRDSALLQIPKSILTAWQTLLLADSEFSQSQGFHLAPMNVNLDVQVQVELELKQIRLLHKLWQTAQRTFSQSGLEETRAVEVFLGGVVRRDFRIGEGRVQGEWVRMCQGVVVYPSREELLRQLEVGGETSPTRSMFNMQTWVIVARRWVEEGVAGDSLVTFLKFPFPERLTTDEEIELWGMLFRVALAAARVHRGANEAAMGLWQALVPDGAELPLAFPKQFHALLSAFVIPFENKTLAEQVLHVMNSVLNSLYPPSMDSNTNAYEY